jgi:aromatic-L-amino-acid decarboxylase
MSGRPDLPLLRVYVSEQSHSSVEKAVITLGLGQRGMRKIPTDSEFRMNAKALAEAINEDKRNGYLPFCIVATVGTTSTSSIDPVREIIPIGEEHAMWLHVDAAYAGSAAIVPEFRKILDGCERADSIVTNPHKWLFTPFDLSVLYCRHMDLLKRAFSLVPEYLRTPEQEKVRSGSDYGIQLGRRFRALKLWMVLRYFGHEGLAARIREHCRLARLFAGWIDESDDWEIMAPVPLGLVCFRANLKDRDDLDALNEAIMHGVNASGRALLSHTRLNDKLTLRLSIGNIRTTEQHVRQVWQLLNEQLQLLR